MHDIVVIVAIIGIGVVVVVGDATCIGVANFRVGVICIITAMCVYACVCYLCYNCHRSVSLAVNLCLVLVGPRSGDLPSCLIVQLAFVFAVLAASMSACQPFCLPVCPPACLCLSVCLSLCCVSAPAFVLVSVRVSARRGRRASIS